MLVNAAERRNSEGKPQFIRLTVFNATDRRRYERELLKARDELSHWQRPLREGSRRRRQSNCAAIPRLPRSARRLSFANNS